MQEKPKILIVDDEKINLNILLNILGLKYEISVALNAQKALKLIQKKKFNLILLDIIMPQMDGFELCKILKSNPQTKDIPIMFITAQTDDDIIEKAYEIGGIDYITKPFRPKELLTRINRELELQRLYKKLEIRSEKLEIKNLEV